MNTFFRSTRSSQTGVVLVVALLFLIVLTLLGVGVSRMVTSEERMSRYLREYNIAFQAAETALRDAREDIDGFRATDQGKVFTLRDARIGPSTTFFPDCSFGLCAFDPTEAGQPWKDKTKWAKAVQLGRYSARSPLPRSAAVGTTPLGAVDGLDESAIGRVGTSELAPSSGVFKQPEYMLESIPDARPGGDLSFGGKNPRLVYRITARGYGADPNSRAMVQEIYESPNQLAVSGS